MAKVTGPLLSFRARGSIAKTQVYAVWRGVDYARQHVIPSNPNTVAQQLTRNTFRTLGNIWRELGSIGKTPWDAFATGRPFIGVNAFLGENIKVVRGDLDFLNLLSSPGSKGGIPPTSVTAAATLVAGEINVTFVNPAPPTGWVLTAAQAIALPDQAPDAALVGPVKEGEDTAAPMDTVLFSGFGSAVTVVVGGWLKWTKPNGDIAYSVGLTDSAVTL